MNYKAWEDLPEPHCATCQHKAIRVKVASYKPPVWRHEDHHLKQLREPHDIEGVTYA